MSTEQNQPGPEMAPEHASNESNNGTQSAEAREQRGPGGGGRFRRRRRRRRGGAAAGQPQPAGEGMNLAAAAEAETSGEMQAPSPAARQENQNAPGQGRRRRKKKRGKFAAGGQQTHQPGNRQAQGVGNFGQGGGRRQKKGRGGRAFVGPMDHSYRATNGNYAEAPPSTIQVNGNHGGRGHNRNAAYHDTGHQSQFLPAYYEPKPPAIAEDAPVKVYCFIEDLFITAKITETARKLGVKVAFSKGEKEELAAMLDAPENERAHLILIDLNNQNVKPMTLVPKIRAKLKKTVSIVGYVGQIQGDLKAKAIEAGCDSVMPRAAFSQALPGLLRRYGLEEDTEPQDSQHAYF